MDYGITTEELNITTKKLNQVTKDFDNNKEKLNTSTDELSQLTGDHHAVKAKLQALTTTHNAVTEELKVAKADKLVAQKQLQDNKETEKANTLETDRLRGELAEALANLKTANQNNETITRELEVLEISNKQADATIQVQADQIKSKDDAWTRCQSELKNMTADRDGKTAKCNELTDALNQSNQSAEKIKSLLETRDNSVFSLVLELSKAQLEAKQKSDKLSAAENKATINQTKIERALESSHEFELKLHACEKRLVHQAKTIEDLRASAIVLKARRDQLEQTAGCFRFATSVLSIRLRIERRCHEDLKARATKLRRAFAKCIWERNAMHNEIRLLNQGSRRQTLVIDGLNLSSKRDASRLGSIAIALGVEVVDHDQIISEIRRLQRDLFQNCDRMKLLETQIDGSEGFKVCLADIEKRLAAKQKKTEELNAKISGEGGLQDQLRCSHALAKAQKEVSQELQQTISGPGGFKEELRQAKGAIPQLQFEILSLNTRVQSLSDAERNFMGAQIKIQRLKKDIFDKNAQLAELHGLQPHLTRANESINTLKEEVKNQAKQHRQAENDVLQEKQSNITIRSERDALSSTVEENKLELARYQEALTQERQTIHTLREDFRVADIAKQIHVSAHAKQIERIKTLNNTRVSILKAVDELIIGRVNSNKAYGTWDWVLNVTVADLVAATDSDVTRVRNLVETTMDLIRGLRCLVREQESSISQLEDTRAQNLECHKQLQSAKGLIWTFRDLLAETQAANCRILDPAIKCQIAQALEDAVVNAIECASGV